MVILLGVIAFKLSIIIGLISNAFGILDGYLDI
jgi:hypothetical protein